MSKLESYLSTGWNLQVLEASASMKWIVNAQHELLYANPAFLDFFGLAKDVLGQSIYTIFPEKLADKFSMATKHVLDKGNLLNQIEKSRQSDGGFYYHLLNITALHFSPAENYVLGEATNVTHLYLEQKEFNKLKERVSHLDEGIDQAVWEWDLITDKIHRNQALYNLVGLEFQHDYSPEWWINLIHPDDKAAVKQSLQSALKNGEKKWDATYRVFKSDGNIISVHDKGYIIHETDRPIKMIGTLQDISELKNLKTELEMQALEHQRKIAQTILMVQDKERNKIGHELHDNVNQILMTGNLFLDMVKTIDPEKAQFIAKAKEYLQMAFDEIRTLSHRLVVPELHGNSLVDSINKTLQDIELTKKLTAVFHADPSVDALSKDRKITFFRIFQEQLKNTLRYSQASKLEIQIQKENGRYWVMTIRDNGVGFDSSLTPRGIGLSNIFERAHLYGGMVKFNSAPGKGCEMIVKIPGKEAY